MTSRDHILDKLRKAAPREPGPLPDVAADAELYADMPVATDVPALLAMFEERMTELKGETHVVPNAEAAAKTLESLLNGAEPGVCQVQDAELIDAVLAHLPEPPRTIQGQEKLADPNTVMGAVDTSVSVVDALVARTASLIVRSSSCGGRRLSVLPPFHIVLARASQLVPSLEDAFEFLSAETDAPWSYGVVISGPARTGDIERILVLGAHGPKRLAVIIIDDTA